MKIVFFPYTIDDAIKTWAGWYEIYGAFKAITIQEIYQDGTREYWYNGERV